MFDTLKLAMKLEQAGFTAEQARGAATALADQLVTKTYFGSRLDSAKTEILKWMIWTMGFQTLVILGGVLALGHLGR